MTVTLPTFKDFLDIAQPISIIFASIIGGLWVLWLFSIRRQSLPRAKITHTTSHRKITNDKVLLSVIVTISNIGDVLIQLEKCQIRVFQVLPPKGDLLKLVTSLETSSGITATPNTSKSSMLETRPGITTTPNVSELSVKSWFQIDSWLKTWKPKLKVEPGESRQVPAHFVIGPDIETVLLYSHITNVRERNRRADLGWELNTLYDLQVAKNDLPLNVVQSPNGAQSSWLKRWRRP